MHLPQQLFDVQLYLLYRRGPYLERLRPETLVHAFSDRNFDCSIPGSIHRAQVVDLASVLRKEQIDVVYDRTFHMTLVTSKACRKMDVPRVSVIVSPPSRDFAGSRERFRWFKYRTLRKAYSHPAATILAVSQSVADDAAEFYRLPSSRLKVITTPVDVAAIQQAAAGACEDAITSADISDKKSLRLIVVGRMTEEKGHQLMLEAVRLWVSSPRLSSLGNLMVDLVGDGPLRSSLQRQTVELGLAEQVRFCGFQANPYPWIARADILCIPSLYEGLPNVALEAMALKKPVMATPSSGAIISLLGDDSQRGLLLREATPNCLVEALESHLRNPLASVTRAKVAFDWILQHHSLSTWIAEMSQVFKAAAVR